MTSTVVSPAHRLTRFLHSYGPADSNTNLYDELVTSNAERYGIEPIELEAEFVDDIVRLLRKPELSHVLIAGVAGDGKSYHLRQVWKALGGSLKAWQKNGDLKLQLELENGQTRTAFFIKDLSADATDFKSELWPILRELNSQTETVLVMACNHGQILSKLRTLGKTDPDLEQEANAFAAKLEDLFFNAQAENSIGRVHVFDLSRPSQADRLKRIIKKIAMHPKWKSCSEGDAPCSHRASCFIQKNLDELWDRDADKPTVVTERLCSLVKLAALNGSHFPIRELFMLVVNAVFGKNQHSSGGYPLGDCDFVEAKIKNPARAQMDLFLNLLGNNLIKEVFEKKSLFRQLAQFEVGAFGNPYFDSLILLGNQDPDIPALDRSYYFGDQAQPTEDVNAKKLIDARRRIFFKWRERKSGSEKILHEKDLWSLTAYPHAVDYLKLLRESLEEEEEQEIPRELIAGLNRILTGSANCKDLENIWIATNGADTRDPVGVLVVSKICAVIDDSNCAAFMIRPVNNTDAVPQLEFRIGRNRYDKDSFIRFALTPRRYEFLIDLAGGALPSSFSKQIQFEFYALKSLLVRAALEQGTSRARRSRSKDLKIRLIEGSPITIKLPDDKHYD